MLWIKEGSIGPSTRPMWSNTIEQWTIGHPDRLDVLKMGCSPVQSSYPPDEAGLKTGTDFQLVFSSLQLCLVLGCVPLICTHDGCCQIENGTLSVSDVALPFIIWRSILLLQCYFRTLSSCFILSLELPLDLTLKRDPRSLLDHIQSRTGCRETPPYRPPLSRVALTGGKTWFIISAYLSRQGYAMHHQHVITAFKVRHWSSLWCSKGRR